MDTENAWCFCGEEKDDEMIACDNPKGCPIEWFHYSCVGIKEDTVPQGDWFCDTCREKLKSKSMMFICEYCEAEFTNRQECLDHKEEHAKPQLGSGRRKQKTPSHKAPKKRRASTPASTASSVDRPHTDPTQGATSLNFPQFSLDRGSKPVDNQTANYAEKPEENTDSSGVNGRVDLCARSPPALERFDAQPTGNASSSEDTSRFSSVQHPVPVSTPEAMPETAPAGKQQALARFSDEQILAELAKRQAAHVCVCGMVFRDPTLYYLHRSTHNTNNPRKCSQCDYVARDWYDFTSHFFIHRKPIGDAAPKVS